MQFHTQLEIHSLAGLLTRGMPTHQNGWEGARIWH